MSLQGDTRPQDSFRSRLTAALISPRCHFILLEFYFQLPPIIESSSTNRGLQAGQYLVSGGVSGRSSGPRGLLAERKRADLRLFVSQPCVAVHYFSPSISVLFVAVCRLEGAADPKQKHCTDKLTIICLHTQSYSCIFPDLGSGVSRRFIVPARRRLLPLIALLVPALLSLQPALLFRCLNSK